MSSVLGVVGAGVLAILVAVFLFGLPPISRDLSPEEAVRSVVEEFGMHLQNVSLLSPTAAQDLQEEYGPYVAPQLLATWQAAVHEAPGRLTSSPYPERIDIESTTKAGDDFIVEGTVVLMSSTGVSGQEKVTLTLSLQEGTWLITSYRKQQEESATLTLGMGESGSALDITIVPQEVLEDSRCPMDVQCIQAGTVRVSTTLESPSGTAPQLFILNQPITTETRTVVLVQVLPAPKAGEPIATSTYQFVFEVRQR